MGAGLAGWAVAREVGRRGKQTALLTTDSTSRVPAPAFAAAGLPYITAVARWGGEAARVLWEAHREDVALAHDLGADVSPGGFLLARSRDHARLLAESEDLARDDGFVGEFLDHYLLEARFDVQGFAAGYWTADAYAGDASLLARLIEEAGAARFPVYEASGLEALETDGQARLVGRNGSVRAEAVVFTSSTEAARLVPFLTERFASHPETWTRLTVAGEARLPAVACDLEAGTSWRAGGDGTWLRIEGDGAASAAYATAHLGLAIPRADPEETTRVLRVLDGLPLVGAVPGAPVWSLCGAGTWAIVAARWLAEAVTGGHDPTPLPLRCTRALAPPDGGFTP